MNDRQQLRRQIYAAILAGMASSDIYATAVDKVAASHALRRADIATNAILEQEKKEADNHQPSPQP